MTQKKNSNPPPVICFLLKGYPRISETFISNEILELEKMGFHIHIISMRHPRENFCHDHIKDIRARVDYLPSSIRPHLRVLLKHNLQLACKKPLACKEALKKGFGRWMRTRKSATIKHLLQAGYLVNHLMPDSNIIHFHAHFAHSPSSVAMFASLLSGKKFSFFAHAKDIYTQNPVQLKEKIDMAAFVVTCTRYNQRFLRRLAKKTVTPIECVRHGINLDFFAMPENFFVIPEKKLSPEKKYRIITVARHAPKKGLDIVIQAMGLLRDKGIDFSHTIIGDGDERHAIESLISDLGLENQIQLTGTLPHHEVINHYRKADLFILGCRITANGDRDGIPNVIAESMAMGVPVVAPRVSGIPELLVHCKTGLMVPSENSEALAKAAEQLLFDIPLRNRLIPAARQKVEQCFNNKKLLPRLAAVYNKGMRLK